MRARTEHDVMSSPENPTTQFKSKHICLHVLAQIERILYF